MNTTNRPFRNSSVSCYSLSCGFLIPGALGEVLFGAELHFACGVGSCEHPCDDLVGPLAAKAAVTAAVGGKQ